MFTQEIVTRAWLALNWKEQFVLRCYLTEKMSAKSIFTALQEEEITLYGTAQGDQLSEDTLEMFAHNAFIKLRNEYSSLENAKEAIES